MVIIKKTALEYTQKKMRKEFSFTTKNQLKKKKKDRKAENKGQKAIWHIENK